jgi:hypothetical protein
MAGASLLQLALCPAEMQAINSNETWDVLPHPREAKPLRVMWVSSLKGGEEIPFKARLGAKGCSHTAAWLGLRELYAPVGQKVPRPVSEAAPSAQLLHLEMPVALTALLHVCRAVVSMLGPNLLCYCSLFTERETDPAGKPKDTVTNQLLDCPIPNNNKGKLWSYATGDETGARQKYIKEKKAVEHTENAKHSVYILLSGWRCLLASGFKPYHVVKLA